MKTAAAWLAAPPFLTGCAYLVDRGADLSDIFIVQPTWGPGALVHVQATQFLGTVVGYVIEAVAPLRPATGPTGAPLRARSPGPSPRPAHRRGSRPPSGAPSPHRPFLLALAAARRLADALSLRA
ncbi:MAG: hypothetical protein AB1486_30865 [Planctomycetota bacterium]